MSEPGNNVDWTSLSWQWTEHGTRIEFELRCYLPDRAALALRRRVEISLPVLFPNGSAVIGIDPSELDERMHDVIGPAKVALLVVDLWNSDPAAFRTAIERDVHNAVNETLRAIDADESARREWMSALLGHPVD